MNPNDLRPQVEAVVRAIGSADYAAAHAELERLRQAMPGASVTLEDEARLADAVVARAYAAGKPADVKAALALREEVAKRVAERPAPAQPATVDADPRKARALALLRASAANGDAPAWSQVARETGIHRQQLVRWWQAAQAPASAEGELVERAAETIRAEVEQSMREWVAPRLAGWRRMVEALTSPEAVTGVVSLIRDDPEAGARTVMLVGKVLEAVPVISRIGDDGAPRGGTARLDEVRRILEGHADGRALLTVAGG